MHVTREARCCGKPFSSPSFFLLSLLSLAGRSILFRATRRKYRPRRTERALPYKSIITPASKFTVPYLFTAALCREEGGEAEKEWVIEYIKTDMISHDPRVKILVKITTAASCLDFAIAFLSDGVSRDGVYFTSVVNYSVSRLCTCARARCILRGMKFAGNIIKRFFRVTLLVTPLV